MDTDNFDWIAALTQQGPAFQDTWSKFLFNLKVVLDLKQNMNLDKEKVIEMFNAGAAYLGFGWSTGRASKALYDLSGVAIVKSQIEPYRDTWLYAVAIILGVDLPTVDLPAECAEAAFALAHHAEHPEDVEREHSDGAGDTDDEEKGLKFGWEEEEQPLPRELTELWQRASQGSYGLKLRSCSNSTPGCLSSQLERKKTTYVQSTGGSKTSSSRACHSPC